jgi:hypothetical protein
MKMAFRIFVSDFPEEIKKYLILGNCFIFNGIRRKILCSPLPVLAKRLINILKPIF